MPGFEELNARINRLKREGGVGYTEKGFAPMIAEMQVEIAANSVPSRVQVEGLSAYPWTTKGTKVRVIWDGIAYERETVPVNETSPWLYIGNFPKTQNKGDTGEPFCIMVSASQTFGQVYDFEDNSVTRTHTLAVEHFTETIHPIDKKYLLEGFGGGGLPVVLEVPYMVLLAILEGGTEPMQLDAEMAATIEKAYSDNVPLYVRGSTGATTIQCRYEWSRFQYDEANGTTKILFVGLLNIGIDMVNRIEYTRDDNGASIVTSSTEIH